MMLRVVNAAVTRATSTTSSGRPYEIGTLTLRSGPKSGVRRFGELIEGRDGRDLMTVVGKLRHKNERGEGAITCA